MRTSLLLCLVLAAVGPAWIAGQDHERPSASGVEDPDRAKAIAGLEKSLLSLLGFSKRPRPARNAHVPDQLRQLYRRQSIAGVADIARRGFNVGSANTVRAFVHAESELDSQFSSPHRFRLLFDVSSMPTNERLRAAELILSRVALIRPEADAEESNEVDGRTSAENDKSTRLVRIMVHDIVRPGIRGKSKPLLRLIDSKVLDVRSNATVSLDVHPAVERWLSKIPGQSQNHGLLVQVVGDSVKRSGPHHKTEHVRLRRSLDEVQEQWQRARPTLFAYTDDGRKRASTANDIMERRARRAANKKNRRKDGRENCRRHPLYVDFGDVGWTDWIVAPPGYDAFYCHGDCPFPLADHLNSTNHAIVQNLVFSTNPQLVPKACCVPTSLGSISMLYLDEENKVVLKNYQDMSVQGCGCR